MATVGELIKTAREAIRPKMSQDDLARLIGVSRASVSAWETNKDVPRHTKHNLLSKILGLPLEAFSPPTAARVNGTEPDSVPRHSILVLEWSDLVLIEKSGKHVPAPAGRQRIGLDATDDPQLAVDDCFAVRITDNSMEPAFRIGDRVVLNRRLEPLDGDAVLARLADGTHLFRYYEPRGERAFDLIPENADNGFKTETVNAASPGEVIGVMVVHERRGRLAGNPRKNR
jgi:DNA-binding XRE family transcriptional regulator